MLQCKRRERDNKTKTCRYLKEAEKPGVQAASAVFTQSRSSEHNTKCASNSTWVIAFQRFPHLLHGPHSCNLGNPSQILYV